MLFQEMSKSNLKQLYMLIHFQIHTRKRNGFVNINVTSNINDTDLIKEIVRLPYNMLLF